MNCRQTNARNSEQGSALVVVVVIMAAIAAVAVGQSFMATTESTLANASVQEKRAFYLAESAVEEAIEYLNALGEPFAHFHSFIVFL